ncbi:MAG: hypothetical protein KIT39_13715, partial [Nitrospirales bacterium]|nr:hypothetical protein [Nitrospirales bacterium]
MLRSLLLFVLAIIFSQPLLFPLSVADSETGRPEDNFCCHKQVNVLLPTVFPGAHLVFLRIPET